MNKINIGDYIHIDYSRENGVVVGDRGGHVGRWVIKLDNGNIGHASSRDCIVIKPSARPERLTVNEKLDLLLEYLGLEIRVEPEVVKLTKVSDMVLKDSAKDTEATSEPQSDTNLVSEGEIQ